MAVESFAPCGPPLMFISSFSCADENNKDGYDPLAALRQNIWELNNSSIRREVPNLGNRLLTWVAEKEEHGLAPSREPDRLKVVDRLIEVLRASTVYVCILAGQRRGSVEHGTAIPFGGEPTAVSYFEVELYAAAMYKKPIKLYLLAGFTPGERLAKLLQILAWAIPDWKQIRPMTEFEILKDIQEQIRQQRSRADDARPDLRRRIADALWGARSNPKTPNRLRPGLLFLGGHFETRQLPEPQFVEDLIRAYRGEPNYQRKLNRIWVAARELMPVSYHPDAVRRRPELARFLPYWDAVLGDWAAAASWHGWHGHLYAGAVAPLNSQMLLRSQAIPKSEEFSPEVRLPPDGAMASAYYSLAGVLGYRLSRWECLRRAGWHVQQAIVSRGPTDNLLAIRGSVRLRMGWWPGAIADFQKMLRLREEQGASQAKIADALMHLGQGYALCPLSSKGTELLHRSIELLSTNDPNLPRVKRKLAFAYRIRGQRTRADHFYREAWADAERLGAYDQMRG
jgi:hypothetical protein